MVQTPALVAPCSVIHWNDSCSSFNYGLYRDEINPNTLDSNKCEGIFQKKYSNNKSWGYPEEIEGKGGEIKGEIEGFHRKYRAKGGNQGDSIGNWGWRRKIGKVSIENLERMEKLRGFHIKSRVKGGITEKV